ncbi:sugar phosphate nucleotidyltransferase [Candidatus Pelagibacter sp. Uisw_106]|uniref:sugar phosphate nucleotidyltransferase n=1 Tax=Candidatus Pelagibacter sp. Uisw_106 TaxID=3230984 RepID=UPI00233950C8|nr:sugar phosphate nucleotidyltransferase [Candidatus Pelagibacter sp.]
MIKPDVVILCGGLGTRITELTKQIPKPMIKIGKKPIFMHIIDIYVHYNIKNFHLALGYKYEEFIKFFFKKAHSENLKKFRKNNHLQITRKIGNKKVNINLHYTGRNTLTGGRLKRLTNYLNDTFFLTYGDGLANVNINRLFSFHKKGKKQVTITAVRPGARFGVLSIKGNQVINFKEKPQVSSGWINGGFFVIEPSFLKLIKDDSTILEKEPLEIVAKKKSMQAYKHKGFWHCIDTLRDKIHIEKIVKEDGKVWIK